MAVVEALAWVWRRDDVSSSCGVHPIAVAAAIAAEEVPVVPVVPMFRLFCAFVFAFVPVATAAADDGGALYGLQRYEAV